MGLPIHKPMYFIVFRNSSLEHSCVYMGENGEKIPQVGVMNIPEYPSFFLYFLNTGQFLLLSDSGFPDFMDYDTFPVFGGV